MSCRFFTQYSTQIWSVLGVLFFLLIMRIWFKRTNRLFTIQLLSEFDEDGDNTLGFVLTHPDDESLFMTPVLEVLRQSNYVAQHELKLRLLMLSRGDYTGSGPRRAFEVEEICHKYNIECTVLNEEDTQDGPNFWQGNKVAEHIKKFVKETGCQVLITFDQYGADSHPNHISTFHAVNSLRPDHPDLKVWTLHTYGVFSKFNPLFAMLRAMFSRPSVIMFSPLELINNMKIHHSQNRWYHTLYAFLSAYSYANSFNAL
ncbi:n-acetylglucosaminyl-ph osphatidylinositol de-n-acetylase, putative [Babesia caballi]|uniref:N-acetylglucosaminylphosphatidylinositol deacetylase n=1 Tax=Babesia caballi TaxID=5871 RepID=A0AAV4LM33_BABCB|nr:n-acetylglucosaminyl-ph osphatidylinositol de-n-acetylase, putative [Babesia caballi]